MLSAWSIKIPVEKLPDRNGKPGEAPLAPPKGEEGQACFCAGLAMYGRNRS